MTIVEDRPRTLEPVRREYQAPALEVLGSLRSLTKGAGPGGQPIVMATGAISAPPFSPMTRAK